MWPSDARRDGGHRGWNQVGATVGLMSGRRSAGGRAGTALPEANWSEFIQVPVLGAPHVFS